MPGYKKRKHNNGKLSVQSTKGYTYKWKKDTKKVNNRISICYTPQMVPDIMRVALKFVVSTSFPIAVNGADFVYRGNSCFDPDFAVGGTQPLGFDQWAAFYRRYRVLSSKCKFRVKNNAPDGNALLMIVAPLNTNTAITNRELLSEQRFAKQEFVGDSNGMDVKEITHYMDTASIRGVPREAVRIDGSYSGLVTGNPGLEWYWHCAAYDASNSLGQVAFDFNVEITYYVEFFDSETLNRS